MSIYDLNGKGNISLEEVPADLKKLVNSILAEKFNFDKYEGKKYQKYNRLPIYIEEYWNDNDDKCYNICYKTYEISYCEDNDAFYIKNYGSSTVPKQCIA